MKQADYEKLPKKITKEIFILLDANGYGNIEECFSCMDFDASKYGSDKILITTKEVTFSIPQNIDVKGKVIEGLETEKEKIQAAFHMKLKDVQDKIDNLLAIEYKP